MQATTKKTKESYPIRSIRLSQDTWELLKEDRWKSKLGWEKYILKLLNKEKPYKK